MTLVHNNYLTINDNVLATFVNVPVDTVGLVKVSEIEQDS